MTAADVDRALSDDRSLLVTWLNRGTLHLVRSEDYPWLQELTTPPLLKATMRRLAEEGVSADAARRAVATVKRSLAKDGPLTRAELRHRLVAKGFPAEGQATYHLLALSCLRGIAVRGPVMGREQAYALVRDWIGEPGQIDRASALAELARRYLAGHGPADDRDLARWAGLPLRDARAGLETIASELEQVEGGRVALKRTPAAAPVPAPRLLGAFDPVLLGWVSRAPLLGSHQGIVTDNGLFRPFALVRGRAAATWRLVKGEVVIEPLGRITRKDARALDQDAADVRRFLAG